MFLDIQNAPMEGGTLYHAVHGLLLYYARVYGPEKLGPLAPPPTPAGPARSEGPVTDRQNAPQTPPPLRQPFTCGGLPLTPFPPAS